MWTKIEYVPGTLVKGDNSAPPTRWWNHLWLAMFGWNMIVTFRVPNEVAAGGYFVGYTPSKGSAWYKKVRCHDEFFSMKVGYEDCVFFALPIDPKQPPCSPTIVGRSKLH